MNINCNTISAVITNSEMPVERPLVHLPIAPPTRTVLPSVYFGPVQAIPMVGPLMFGVENRELVVLPLERPKRPRSVISDDDKERIVKKFRESNDLDVSVKFASDLGVKGPAAYRIIRDRSKSPRPKPGGKTYSKVTPEMKARMVEIVEDHPLYTLDEINAELRNTFDAPHQQISKSTVARTLEGALISVKKATHFNAQRDSDGVKAERLAFANAELNDDTQRVKVWVDECGSNLYTGGRTGRCKKGERLYRLVSPNKGKNVSTIAAVCTEFGLVRHEQHVGGATKALFFEFMEALSTRMLELTNLPVVFILDNCRIHNDCDGALKSDIHRVLRLPRYSPEFNPIEPCFFVLKNQVGKGVEARRQEILNIPLAAVGGETKAAARARILTEIIRASVNVITAEKVAGFYRLTLRFYGKAIRNENFGPTFRPIAEVPAIQQ